ncbi:LytTR family transcriptional regulator DNA-binding domain-containing protein [Gracilibacillus alcaliphilus]|uniref:LytTR family transcriptional regulator DNA-binding domain-containing protein n=1 Tax=Gracilibacillus alcaliphilus TaxID=1401441 RepID=UPI00195F1179|nr:two-component system response regulator AgrA [Gracilibacillus alcaliphilus]
MLEVFICEDEKQQRERLTNFIQTYIESASLDMAIAVSTDNPKDIIEYLQENQVKGIYFLDVYLQTETEGIELAAKIREYDQQGALVFITTHPELMALTFTYKVEAMDYITKGDFQHVKKKVKECLELAHQRLQTKRTQPVFSVRNKGKVIIEEYQNIMFFETSPNKHRIILHAANRQVEFYGKLKKIEPLHKCLCRCHRAYVVNVHNIAEINVITGEILMKNNEICFVSHRAMKKLLRALKESRIG